jgi:hypothetical protein
VFRPTRFAATAAVVLVPLAVATGSGAPPLPVSASLQSDPVPAPTVLVPSTGAGTALAAPELGIAATDASPALATSGDADVLDIPATALAAYQRATAVVSEVDPGCAMTWELLAAVGRVESDHGRVGGATLNPDGTSTPAVRGPVLDGRGPFAAISDTDGGILDGDAEWDRAVGPMQFLPSTWMVVSVDADGDGLRSPNDIDDAALGAAVYLCFGADALDTDAGARTALLRYNHSTAYADRVLEVAHAYTQGSAVSSTGSSIEAIIARNHEALTATPAVPEHGPKHGGPSAGVFAETRPTADFQPTRPPRPEHHPSPTKPEPTPTDPEPTDPTPADPEPTDPPTTDPTPTPEPATLTGTLDTCAADASAWCVGDVVLDLGDDAYLATQALSDFDSDGVVETNGEEIAGLVGAEVTLVVTEGTTPARVEKIDGAAYRSAGDDAKPAS